MDYPTRDALFTRGEELDLRIHYLGDWFDRAPILAAVGDSTHLRQVNNGWETFLGWDQKEILALQWTSIIHPHDLDQTIEACLYERLPLRNFPNRYLSRKGEYVWIRWFMDFPDEDLFYSCGVPVTDGAEALQDIAERRAKVFEVRNEQQ